MTEQLPNTHLFAQLSDGRCHYRIDGPSGGCPLLLIHGATVPGWQFALLVPYLTAAGWRTIRLDLFGHGYSDRPLIDHDYALFTRQIFELLELLDLHRDIYLLGHSLGSVVAARLMLAAPQKFNALIMAAPILNFFANEKAARLLRVPVLGECLIDSYVMPMLTRRRTRRYRAIDNGQFVGRFHEQLKVPGFSRALLSLLRSDALTDQRESYIGINRLENPVLLLRGSDDTVVTASQMRVVNELVPRAESYTIDGTSHAMLLTDPKTVAPYVIQFLAERF